MRAPLNRLRLLVVACGVLFVAVMVYAHWAPRLALRAYQKELGAPGVPLTLEECMPEGFPLSSTNRDPETVRLSVAQDAPELWITVSPNARSQVPDAEGHAAIGFIDVAAGSPPSRIQTLDVWGADQTRVKSRFRVLDINFDGYPDMMTAYEASAKAGRCSLWLYDPGIGLFATNAVTDKFKSISYNTLALDRERQLIRMTHLSSSCTNSWETWRIQDGELLNVEAVIHTPQGHDTCHVAHLRREDGRMQLVQEEQASCPKPASDGGRPSP